MVIRMISTRLLCQLILLSTCASYVIRKDPKPYLHQEEHVFSRKGLLLQEAEGKCHPLTIPMCRRLGYNTTSYHRNIYDEPTNEKAEMAGKYLKLFENELCFEDLLFFVCTLYNPICMQNHQQVMLPCRTECRNVKRQCKDTFKKFKMEWPKQLKCHQLPDYQTDVCLTKESIVTQKRKFFNCILRRYNIHSGEQSFSTVDLWLVAPSWSCLHEIHFRGINIFTNGPFLLLFRGRKFRESAKLSMNFVEFISHEL